jgi:hypothetical protein
VQRRSGRPPRDRQNGLPFAEGVEGGWVVAGFGVGLAAAAVVVGPGTVVVVPPPPPPPPPDRVVVVVGTVTVGTVTVGTVTVTVVVGTVGTVTVGTVTVGVETVGSVVSGRGGAGTVAVVPGSGTVRSSPRADAPSGTRTLSATTPTTPQMTAAIPALVSDLISTAFRAERLADSRALPREVLGLLVSPAAWKGSKTLFSTTDTCSASRCVRGPIALTVSHVSYSNLHRLRVEVGLEDRS